MDLARFTGLGRPIDLRYPSNVAALVGTGIAALVAVLYGWRTSGQVDLMAAASTAVGVFLAWAVARELDPDRSITATVALTLAIGAGLLGPAAPALVGVVLIALRLVVGSVGARLRAGDLAVLLAASAYAGSRPDGWPAVAALAFGAAVAAASRHRWLPWLVGAAGVGAALVTGASPAPGWPGATSTVVLIVAVLATGRSVPVGGVQATSDIGGNPIAPQRVTAARLIAGMTVLLGGLLGASGALGLAPVAAALVALALVPARARRTVARVPAPLPRS